MHPTAQCIPRLNASHRRGLEPLFTGVRGRGILRSSHTRSCITLRLSGRRCAYSSARVPNPKPYILWCCIKMRLGGCRGY
jgi:hypothetical protein